MTPKVCDRRRKQAVCAVLVHSVSCGQCGKTYTRCELHGGSKGANLSLHSHCALSGHRRYGKVG